MRYKIKKIGQIRTEDIDRFLYAVMPLYAEEMSREFKQLPKKGRPQYSQFGSLDELLAARKKEREENA